MNTRRGMGENGRHSYSLLTQPVLVIVKMDVMGADCDDAGPGCNKYAGECFQLIKCIPDIRPTLKVYSALDVLLSLLIFRDI